MSGEEIDRDNVKRRVNGDGGVRRLSEPHENMNEPEGSNEEGFIPISWNTLKLVDSMKDKGVMGIN